ncbi:MAG: helix-turn-helix domain-containing protein [Planctomycetota bacterium]|jgi:PTS system nitrogen regulatory IIA component
MLTVKETAALLRVSEKTVYRWVGKGKVPHVRVGGQYRFPRSELLSWARERGKAVSGPLPPRRPQSEEPTFVGLHDAIGRGGVHYQVEGEDKRSAIDEMLGLIPLPPDIDREGIRLSVQEREGLGTTGIGDGIAVPHMRYPSELLPASQVSLCLLARPLEWASIDGQPVTLVFLPCCPTLQDHLHLMSRIAFTVRDPRWCLCMEGSPERSRILTTLAEIEADFAAVQG